MNVHFPLQNPWKYRFRCISLLKCSAFVATAWILFTFRCEKVPLSLRFYRSKFTSLCAKVPLLLQKCSASVAFSIWNLISINQLHHPYNIYKCITFEYKERKIRQVSFFFSVDISFIEGLYCNKTGTFFDFPWTKPLFQALFLKIEKTFPRKFRFRCENVPLLLQPKIATKLELCPVNIKFSNYCSVFRLFPWPDFDSRQLHCTSEHTGKCPDHYNRPDEEPR